MLKFKMLFTTLLAILLLNGGYTYANSATLSFNGQINYSAPNGSLTLAGSLTGFEELSVTPDLSGSTFTLTTFLNSELYTSTTSEADFVGSSGLAVYDFQINSGNGESLLSGNVLNMNMSGVNGFTFGFLSGDLMGTGGLLHDDFSNGPANLLGLGFNLSTPFSSNMFSSDFSGNVNGSLIATSVFESSSILLFLTGLFGLININYKRKY